MKDRQDLTEATVRGWIQVQPESVSATRIAEGDPGPVPIMPHRPLKLMAVFWIIP